MKTDRELLEAAARAAGKPPPLLMHGPGLNWGYGWWNPFADPSEAIELAVELDMEVKPCQARPHGKGVQWSRVSAALSSDKLRATCRAIVLAAAEMDERRLLGDA